MKILKSFSSSLFNNVLLKWIARTLWINLKAWIIYLGRRTHLVGYTNISLEWVYFLFPQNSGGVFLFILILYLMTTNLKCVEDSNIMEKYKGVKSTQIQCRFATSFLVSTFTSILLNPVTLYIRCCYLQCVYSAIWCFCSSRCHSYHRYGNVHWDRRVCLSEWDTGTSQCGNCSSCPWKYNSGQIKRGPLDLGDLGNLLGACGFYFTC